VTVCFQRVCVKISRADKIARRQICTSGQNYAKTYLHGCQICTGGQICTKTLLHEETFLHEQTILHGDTFARRVTFARVTILHGGSILHEFLFFPRDGSELHEATKLHEQTFLHKDNFARTTIFTGRNFCKIEKKIIKIITNLKTTLFL